VCITGGKLDLRDTATVITSGFIKQIVLEKTLYNLKIKDRERDIYLKNFNGHFVSEAVLESRTGLINLPNNNNNNHELYKN